MSDIDSDEYRELLYSPDYVKILEKVAVPNTTWRRKRGGELLDIARGSLTEEAKAWFYFMNSRLLLSMHVSTLYKDRAIFLYAILKKYKFNVGNIIQQSLLEKDTKISLTHPDGTFRIY